MLSIVLLQAAADSVLAVEPEDTLVPILTARSRTKGIFRFDNETLDSLFGGSKGHRVERDGAAGADQLEPEAKPTLLAIPRSETRTAKFSRRTPRGAAALRIAEKGRALMKAGEYENALLAFEKSLALDPNPYLYYDLAHAHHHLAQYRESSSFVDAAAPWLVDYHERTSALAKIKNENGRALATQAAARHAIQQESGPDNKPESASLNKTSAFIGYLFEVSFGAMLLYFLLPAVRKIEASLRWQQPPA
ncbi:MAG: tetratricopeptide repeat protein [Candidatus Binatia bacterium]